MYLTMGSQLARAQWYVSKKKKRINQDWKENVPVFVVDLVSVPGCIDDVQPQLDTVFNNDCANGMGIASSASYRVQ